MKSCTETSVTLGWNPPAYDGGSPISRYVIERREPSKRTWISAGATTSGDQLEFTIDNLSVGQAYAFRVAAENTCGVGEFAETQQPVIPKSQFGTLLFR